MANRASIYLASGSPRRQALLTQIGIRFESLTVAVDESLHVGESAADAVQRLALDKAGAGWSGLAADARLPVLGADTLVAVGGRILGKPHDRQQGVAMLQSLSGSTHQVLTAVALAGARQAVRLNSSHVTFRTLTVDECEAYWYTGEPADKAGGYAIQGLAGAFVTRLEGSYSGVMGLPLYETAELLSEFGVNILRQSV